VRRNVRPPPTEEGRIKNDQNYTTHTDLLDSVNSEARDVTDPAIEYFQLIDT